MGPIEPVVQDTSKPPTMPTAKKIRKLKRRPAPSPAMRSCVKCGRIYPARALVTPRHNLNVRVCGADALKAAKLLDCARLSRLKVIARKARLYDRKGCR